MNTTKLKEGKLYTLLYSPPDITSSLKVKGMLLTEVEDGFTHRGTFLIGKDVYVLATITTDVATGKITPKITKITSPGEKNPATDKPYTLADIAVEFDAPLPKLIDPPQAEFISDITHDAFARVPLELWDIMTLLRTHVKYRAGDVVLDSGEDGSFVLIDENGGIELINPDGTFIACSDFDKVTGILNPRLA